MQFLLDISEVERGATATHILLDAIRLRDQARQMMLRLHPMISDLREALQPLEAEYNKWAVQHYSCEYRIAEVKKQLCKPHAKQERSTISVSSPEMTDKQAEKYFHSLNATEQAKLIGQLEALRKE